MKVYIEYDDFHNIPRLETFESEDAALKRILGAERVEPEELYSAMFNEDSDEYTGDFYGMNRWTRITEEEARGRSEYWDSVAEAIRFDKEAP